MNSFTKAQKDRFDQANWMTFTLNITQPGDTLELKKWLKENLNDEYTIKTYKDHGYGNRRKTIAQIVRIKERHDWVRFKLTYSSYEF